MDATVRAVCPSCQAALRIPAQWVGQAVKCKKCGAQVRVKAKEEGPGPDDTAPATPLPPSFGVPAPTPQDNAGSFPSAHENAAKVLEGGLFGTAPAANAPPAPPG